VTHLLPTASTPLDPVITRQGSDADQAWHLFLYLGYAVMALVAVLVAVVVVRYRRRGDDLPQQKHYNIPVELVYTIVPLVVVLGLFVVSWRTIDTIEASPPDDDLVVDVTAFQWQWRFDYPDSDVTVVGGADPDELPVLVLPEGSRVRFHLESLDVIHSFWVTAFRFKRDMIPGSPTEFTVDLLDDVAGDYPNAGACAEFCGYDHARMRFGLRVLPADEFAAWVTEHAGTTVVGDSDAARPAPPADEGVTS